MISDFPPQTHLPNIKVHAYFAPVTPPPSVGGSRQRFCRCCVLLWCKDNNPSPRRHHHHLLPWFSDPCSSSPGPLNSTLPRLLCRNIMLVCLVPLSFIYFIFLGGGWQSGREPNGEGTLFPNKWICRHTPNVNTFLARLQRDTSVLPRGFCKWSVAFAPVGVFYFLLIWSIEKSSSSNQKPFCSVFVSVFNQLTSQFSGCWRSLKSYL